MAFGKNIGLKTKMMIGSSAPLALVVILSVVCMWSIKLLLETTANVDYSHRIMKGAQKIEKLISDLEIGERGFLIAGQDEFLKPYIVGKDNLSSQIAQTKKMVENDQTQVKRLTTIESLINQWYETAATPEIAQRRKVEERIKNEDYLKNVLAKGIGQERLNEIKLILENLEMDFFNAENMSANKLVLKISKDMDDMKNGVRAFLITGKEEFLNAFREAQKTFQVNIWDLKFIWQNIAYDQQTTSDNISKIEKISVLWQTETGEIFIQLRKQLNDKSITFEQLIETYMQKYNSETLKELYEAISSILSEFDSKKNYRAMLVVKEIAKYTSEMQMGIRGYILSGAEDDLKPYQDAKNNIVYQIMELKDIVEESNNVKDTQQNIEKIETVQKKWIEEDVQPQIDYRIQMNQNTAVMADVTQLIQAGAGKKFMDGVRKELESFTLCEQNVMESRQKTAETTANLTKNLIIAGTSLTLIIALIISFFLTRSITGPFKEIFQGLDSFSLTELQDVQTQFGQVTESLIQSGQMVNEASHEIAHGANVQATRLQDTSSSMEKISSMTRMNNTNANQANNLMKEANLLVERTNQAMSDLRKSMDSISEASDKTVKIIKSIDEIAFQTNLLSLNASIEAARAGEQGAGFAIVADEVRSLAMRSKEAANSTAKMIEGNVTEIRGGNELVSKTAQAFSEVAEIAAKVAKLVNEIASASNEQTQGIEQINKAISEMEGVTQQNATSTANLSEQSTLLNEQVKIMLTILEGEKDESNSEKSNSEKNN